MRALVWRPARAAVVGCRASDRLWCCVRALFCVCREWASSCKLNGMWRIKRKEELFESSKGGAFWDAVKQGRTMVHQDLEAKKDRIHKMKYVRSPACVCVWGCVCMAEAHVVAL